MRKIDQLFAEYAESHRNSTNKTIHWICVPLIFFSILGLLSIIPSAHVCAALFGCISTVSIVLLALASIYYFSLSWRIGIMMVIVMLLLEHLIYSVNIHLPGKSLWLYIVVFLLAWIGQFFGHKIEGKKPSFLKDLQFLLIGPIWLLHFILKKVGIRY